MDAGQALWWRGGGHQQHQVEAMGGRQGREGLGFFQGQIGHHQTGGAGGSGLLAEALHAPVQQGIAVREQHHRNLQLAPQAGEQVQHPAGGGAGGQGAGGGLLDHRTIGQRIAVGNAQFNQIGATPLQGQQGLGRDLQRRVAGHQKGHQGTATLGTEVSETTLNGRFRGHGRGRGCSLGRASRIGRCGGHGGAEGTGGASEPMGSSPQALPGRSPPGRSLQATAAAPAG